LVIASVPLLAFVSISSAPDFPPNTDKVKTPVPAAQDATHMQQRTADGKAGHSHLNFGQHIKASSLLLPLNQQPTGSILQLESHVAGGVGQQRDDAGVVALVRGQIFDAERPNENSNFNSGGGANPIAPPPNPKPEPMNRSW